MAGSIYHYTDVNAVRSIIEKRLLWLSDIRFLNDSQEMNDGSRYLIDALDNVELVPGVDDHYFECARQILKESFDLHISSNIDREPTFVCSFSEAGNQLSQWRAYGSYAIELDLAVLDADLFYCYYDEAEKTKEAAVMVRDAIHGLANDLQENGGEPSEASASYLSLLVRTASVFKDPSFHEEKEIRWAVDLRLPSEKLKFRSRGDILVPYMEMSFPFDAIKAVHVGPMRDQDLAYTAMCAYVGALNHKWKVQGGGPAPDIRVIQSTVPYRSPL